MIRLGPCLGGVGMRVSWRIGSLSVTVSMQRADAIGPGTCPSMELCQPTMGSSITQSAAGQSRVPLSQDGNIQAALTACVEGKCQPVKETDSAAKMEDRSSFSTASAATGPSPYTYICTALRWTSLPQHLQSPQEQQREPERETHRQTRALLSTTPSTFTSAALPGRRVHLQLADDSLSSSIRESQLEAIAGVLGRGGDGGEFERWRVDVIADPRARQRQPSARREQSRNEHSKGLGPATECVHKTDMSYNGLFV
ncbi:hypothetical protein WMY93_011736 [Mugilogobius chulae]|uniref:Uncharacterized protein n=1 Tax=Mugilogobius chulae TaxID=88201 RepID=A0AAW0P4T1_9GOBI